ncbi:MAG: hypothetical protein AAGA76_08175, partial [Pseudomonadota bacterium]
AGEAKPIFPFVVALFFLVRNFKFLPHILLAGSLSFAGCIYHVKKETLSLIEDQMLATLSAGGCIIVKQSGYSARFKDGKVVNSIGDVEFGTFIGHASPRLHFVSPNSSMEWVYSTKKTKPSHVKFDQCV